MFSKRFLNSCLAFAMLGAVAPGLRAQTASEGEAVYTRRCASCHRSGSPVAAPELGTAVSYAYARFREQVRNGRDLPEPQIDMPAFPRAVLTDRDVCSLYLYARSSRPEAAGESATVCGIKAPSDPAPDPGDGSSDPTPPAPPNPALDANRRHFAPARGTTYRLECRGGDSAAAVMMAGSDGGTSEHHAWRYRLEFLELRGDASLRRASCIWVGPVPPGATGSGAYRLRLEWGSALSPAFQTVSYRAVDNAVRVDSDRRLLYPALYRELVEAVSRPDATFAFEVWYPPRAGGGRGSELQVSAAAVQLNTGG